ncbi:hypothetical protein ACFLQN_04820 [Candidatus Aenigmatarchaeota archaeon]
MNTRATRPIGYGPPRENKWKRRLHCATFFVLFYGGMALSGDPEETIDYRPSIPDDAVLVEPHSRTPVHPTPADSDSIPAPSYRK